MPPLANTSHLENHASPASMRGVLILICLLISAPLAADDAGSLFAQGRAHYASGDYQRAYDAYRRAFELNPGYDIAANLGNVEVEIGLYADAADHLAYAKRTTPASLEKEKRKQILAKIDERMAQALEHAGRVSISVKPANAVVQIDHATLTPEQRDNGKFVSVGTHRITASAPGHDTLALEVTVQPADLRTHHLVLTPAVSTAEVRENEDWADTSSTSADDGEHVRPLAIVGIVTGASSVGVGIALMVLSATAEQERLMLMEGLGNAEGACDPVFATDPGCDEIEDLSADERTFRGVGIGLLAGGGAMLAGSLVYLLWPTDPAAKALQVTPAISPSLAGIHLKAQLW